MRSRDIPWVWALSLHNLSGSIKHADQDEEVIRTVIEKILAHPSPGAETLYWAALICANSDRPACKVPELFKRLMEVDGDNVYSFATYFDTELADKTGLHRVSDELLDWSYFDSWLENAVSLNRVESYHSSRYAEFAKILEEYAQTEGVPSHWKDAPLKWKVAFYISDHLVYPWYGSVGRVTWHCHMGLYFGRTETTELCRVLSHKLLDHSNSFVSRNDALNMLSETYSKSEPEFLRFKREAVAWQDKVPTCLNRIWTLIGQPWSISYDAHVFVQDYEARGQIAALQSLAQSEGWEYQDVAGNKYQCTEALELDDEGLIQFLGKDPAWMWCGDGDLCNLPKPIYP